MNVVFRCDAVWCSVVQRGAVCCSVFHFAAVWCSVVQCGAVWLVFFNVLYCVVRSRHTRSPVELLQCVAVRCSALQYVAVRCSVLQCVAVCCSVLQCVAVCCTVAADSITFYIVAVCCSVLQCVAVCCSALQCAITCDIPCMSEFRVFCFGFGVQNLVFWSWYIHTYIYICIYARILH